MQLWENISAEALQELSTEQAWHYRILPYKVEGRVLHCYYPSETTLAPLQEELEMLLGRSVTLCAAPVDELQKAIGRYYRRSEQRMSTSTSVNIGDESDFLSQLIREAQQLGGSDIHMEPYEQAARVRFRIDGALIEKYQLPLSSYPSLVNQIKIKANLDIAEKRLPQDGRIFFGQGAEQMDIRVSSLPTLHGEKIVMRLLANKAEELDVEDLGFMQEEKERYLESVRRPNGVVLISGPTGSGKTTTLYATLKILNEVRYNIVTIEDPIEYTLEGINQVQLKEAIGLDFASAMRTFLRQDPDVIMVGEIRDLPTASMAIRASLTGHLVLSTIHTNSAWGIIARLIDMGAPAYLLADTLNAAVAQRLLRLLCPSCKQEVAFDESELSGRFQPKTIPRTYYQAVGCEACYYNRLSGTQSGV